MSKQLEAYDVLQIKRGENWLDFSTLRTVDEFRRAEELVKFGIWDGQKFEFRVRRGFNFIVLEA